MALAQCIDHVDNSHRLDGQVSATVRPWRAPENLDADKYNEWAAFTDAVAGYTPMPVTITRYGDITYMYAGVWTKELRAQPGAPNGTQIAGALVAVQNRITPAQGFCVTAAGDIADIIGASRDTALHSADRVRFGELEVTGAHLAKIASIPHHLHRVDRIDVHPQPARKRLRFGAGAEAAYHTFCHRWGHDLISTDGSAQPGTNTFGWAWFATENDWAAGAGRCGTDGGVGRAALHGEFTAALEALRAHNDRHVAIAHDWDLLKRTATGERAPEHDLEHELVGLVSERGTRGLETVWFPLSSSSSSQLHAIVDCRSAAAEHELLNGRAGLWGPHTGVPGPELRRGKWSARNT